MHRFSLQRCLGELRNVASNISREQRKLFNLQHAFRENKNLVVQQLTEATMQLKPRDKVVWKTDAEKSNLWRILEVEDIDLPQGHVPGIIKVETQEAKRFTYPDVETTDGSFYSRFLLWATITFLPRNLSRWRG